MTYTAWGPCLSSGEGPVAGFAPVPTLLPGLTLYNTVKRPQMSRHVKFPYLSRCGPVAVVPHRHKPTRASTQVASGQGASWG